MKQWQSLMAAEEKRTGLPAGMLASLVQQETGGQQRFIDNPADFHYKVGPNGEKPKSTARGLGGILESTARDPGYGVTPLKNWTAPEQLRFMADYAQARIKQAGSVQGGLAGYGEGGKYAQQVAARMGKSVPAAPVEQAVVQEPPMQMVQAPVAEQVAQAQVPAPVVEQSPPWQEFQQAMPAPRVQVADLAYGLPEVSAPRVDPFAVSALSTKTMQPNFGMFKAFRGRA